MSMFFRLTRTQGIKKSLAFLASKDATTCDIIRRCESSTPKKTEDIFEPPYTAKRTWVSYGFDNDDQRTDRHLMHQTFFVGISICLVFGAVVIGYMPDPFLKDWALREAYIQLRHREENGLPLVDPNLIDPGKFTLPEDHELGETDIII